MNVVEKGRSAIGKPFVGKASILLFVVALITLVPSTVRASETDTPEMPKVVELSALPGAMQTVPDVDNPSAVEFTASVDHANVDSYELDIQRPDGSVLQTLNLGKPAPDATGTIRANLNVQPIAFGNGYFVRVRAKAGTAVSAYATSVNKFNRVPGGPSKVEVK